MALARGNLLLEIPSVLQDERPLLRFNFVTDDIAGIGSGNAKQLHFNVGYQLAIVNGKRQLHGVLVPDDVILALLGNAPPVQLSNPFLGVKKHPHGAVIAALRTKDFVSDAFGPFDLVGREDIDRFIGVQQDSIGLLVVGGQRRVHQSAHPRRRLVSCLGRRRPQQAADNNRERE